MARYLLFINYAFAVIAASMVIGVGVTALLLWINLDLAPQNASMMVTVLKLSASYFFVLMSSLLAARSLQKQQAWHWALQVLFVLSLIFAWQFSVTALSNN